jgi:hypothetical protein
MIVAVKCVNDVQVIGIDIASGRLVAQRDFPLTNQTIIGSADVNGASAPCGDVEPRQLFDSDYQRLAVTLQDPASNGQHTGFIDGAGKIHDLTGPQSGSFSSTVPHDDHAAFDRVTGEVWFTSTDSSGALRAYSRSAQTDVLADRGSLPNAYGLALAQGHARATNFELAGPTWAMNPSGTALEEDSIDPFGHSLKLQVLSGATWQHVGIALSDQQYDIQAFDWIDDHTLLCKAEVAGATGNNNFVLVTLGSDYRTANISPLILPPNERTDTPLALSPDRHELLFKGAQGNIETFYRVALTPGATPQQLPDLSPLLEPSTANGPYQVIEWR